VSASYQIFSSWWHDVVQWGRYFLLFHEYWCLSLDAQKRNMPSQHRDSDRCAAVFIISFVSTVLLSLRHVTDIVSWLLHVLTHVGVRPTLIFHLSATSWSWKEGATTKPNKYDCVTGFTFRLLYPLPKKESPKYSFGPSAKAFELYSQSFLFEPRLEHRYPYWIFSWFSSFLPGKYPDTTLTWVTIASFSINC
jgi:hypothetical protein